MSRPPVRVGFLNDHLGWDGTTHHGVSRYFLSVIPHLDRQCVEPLVVILRPRDALAEPFEAAGIPIRFLGRRGLAALPGLWRVVRTARLQVLHAQGYAATTLARLLRPLTGAAVVIHSHDADDRYPLVMSLADRVLAGVEDVALANSRDALEFFERRRRVPQGATRLIYNGVDLEGLRPGDEPARRTAREELAIPAGAEVVLTVTRFRPEKGNPVLLRAARLLLRQRPRALLVFAGAGPDLEDCRRLAAELGVAHAVRFAGFRHDVPTLMSLARVAAIPSLREGTCYALLESLALGVPTVASRVGGPAEILEEGVTGLLVPPGDPAALAAAVERVLADPDLAGRLSREGRRRAADFDVRVHARQLTEIYERLVPQAGP